MERSSETGPRSSKLAIRRWDGKFDLFRKGASYLGLSSGATFLNAIRRLSPQAVAELSPNGAFITSGSLVMGGCSNALQGLNPNPAEQQVVLPSAVKTKSLVESYFRYFRECSDCNEFIVALMILMFT